MKKPLIAFAALSAIAGMAQAQSSVTLYGLVDAFVGQTQTQVTGAAKVKRTVVDSDGQYSSRFGFRGTEDLGGGLKGVFALEGGFSPDTGAPATAGVLFGRQAFVGLSGGFGTVSLGRHLTAYDALHGATNMVYDSNFETTSSVWAAGLPDYQIRASNSISYASPDFAGFSGGVVYGLGENKTATTKAEDNFSFHVKYANGPLLIGFAHQQEKQFSGATPAYFTQPALPAVPFNAKRKYNLVGASFDFGVVKLVGQYNQAKGQTGATTSAKDDEFQIGVSVPFGAAAIAAGYSIAKTEITGGAVNENTSNGLSLLSTYSLSKRTNVYAGFKATKLESRNATVETKASTVAVGVRHLF